MIQMFHVDRRYDAGAYGIRDVSLSIERGEFAFLTGSSGAGKTTLLRLLFGADRPSAGQILVAGRNVSRLAASRVPELRREIGVIFQDFKLLADRSVFENVALAPEIDGVPRSEIRARVWSILNRSPGGSSSASRSPGRSSTIPPCCSRTSRRETSTRIWPSTSWTSSPTPTPGGPP
jgi:cell division transport system ATP-binding protein